MVKYNWDGNKEAIAGNSNPQITVDFLGNVWFMWRNYRFEEGIHLAPLTDSTAKYNEIVIAQFNQGFVEKSVAYQVNGDSVQPRSLCVTQAGPVGFWTEDDKNTNHLHAGINGKQPITLEFPANIWDVRAVSLAGL